MRARQDGTPTPRASLTELGMTGGKRYTVVETTGAIGRIPVFFLLGGPTALAWSSGRARADDEQNRGQQQGAGEIQ